MINLLIKKYRIYLNKVIKMAFTCNYCNSNFTEKSAMKRHIKSKHEVVNFRCERCEFTTNRKDKLTTHTKSKHYQNKFKCPECSVEFSRKDNLVRHMKEYHPKDPLALMENHSTPTATPAVCSPTPAVVTPTPDRPQIQRFLRSPLHIKPLIQRCLHSIKDL